MSFTPVTVNLAYAAADGSVPAGTVTFQPTSAMSNGGTTVPVTQRTVTLTNGQASVVLDANDDAGTIPTGTGYTVIEQIQGANQRTYTITLTHTQTTVSLAALAPAVPQANYSYMLLNVAQTAENSYVEAFHFLPVTAGSERWQVQENSFANAGAGAGTYNHAAFLGWNAGRHSGGDVVNGKPAILMGFEDNYFDNGGSNKYGVEWYVEYWSPDGTSVQSLRPFYARVEGSNTNTANNSTIHMDIGTDGTGVLGIYAGLVNPALFSIQPTAITLGKNTTHLGGTFTLQPTAGQAVFLLNSPAPPTISFQINGAQAFFVQAQSTTSFAIQNSGGTNLLKLTSAGSVVMGAAALATAATDGFTYIPTAAGAPTGVPTAQTGTAPIVYDTTNNKLWVYNGAWKGAVFA